MGGLPYYQKKREQIEKTQREEWFTRALSVWVAESIQSAISEIFRPVMLTEVSPRLEETRKLYYQGVERRAARGLGKIFIETYGAHIQTLCNEIAENARQWFVELEHAQNDNPFMPKPDPIPPQPIQRALEALGREFHRFIQQPTTNYHSQWQNTYQALLQWENVGSIEKEYSILAEELRIVLLSMYHTYDEKNKLITKEKKEFTSKGWQGSDTKKFLERKCQNDPLTHPHLKTIAQQILMDHGAKNMSISAILNASNLANYVVFFYNVQIQTTQSISADELLTSFQDAYHNRTPEETEQSFATACIKQFRKTSAEWVKTQLGVQAPTLAPDAHFTINSLDDLLVSRRLINRSAKRSIRHETPLQQWTHPSFNFSEVGITVIERHNLGNRKERNTHDALLARKKEMVENLGTYQEIARGIDQLKKDMDLNDRDVALLLRNTINGVKKENWKKVDGQPLHPPASWSQKITHERLLVSLADLLFGVEVARHPSALVYHAVMCDLVEMGAIAWDSVLDTTQTIYTPLAIKATSRSNKASGAVKIARYIDDYWQDAFSRPHIYPGKTAENTNDVTKFLKAGSGLLNKWLALQEGHPHSPEESFDRFKELIEHKWRGIDSGGVAIS